MYDIQYLEAVLQDDIPKLSKTDSRKIKRIIENQLTHKPFLFGKTLRYSLKNCRCLRAGSYRIVFKIEKTTVVY